MAKTYDYKNGSGSEATAYSFTFPYIKDADVKVKVFNTSTDTWDPKTLGVAGATETEYYIHNATSIKFASGHVPADADNNIYIYRESDKDKLAATFYPGSAIRSTDLNENYIQNLYASEESAEKADLALDNSRELQTDGSYKTAITRATEAEAIAEAADEIADAAQLATDTYVHDGTNLKGDGQGSNPKGVKYAVDQVDAYVHDGTNPQGDGIGGNPQGLKYAIDTADTAKDTADDADANATTALNNSRESDGSGGFTSAIYIANQADGNATTALNNSRNSASPPVSAISIATDAADDAAEALSNSRNTASPPVSAITIAEDAYNNAVKQDGVTPSGGPDAAITIAEAADTTATTAETAVNTYVHDGTSVKGDGIGSNPKGVAYAINVAEQARDDVLAAVLYSSVTNKAALEALNPTEDGDYQVTDSTGLTDGDTWTDDENSSITYTITGIDPTTDDYPTAQLDGITTRLKYTDESPDKTFTFVSYFANDSDDRYMVGPATDGSNGQYLQTNGAGVKTWADAVSQADTAANIPTGTTGQQPGTPAAGMFRFNTTESEFEGYDGSEWGKVGGGMVTIDAGNFNNGTSLVNTTEIYDGGDFDS